MGRPERIIHKELSYRVNGCIFDVHNEVGPGVREECYQKAMEHRLFEADIPFLPKPKTRREFVYRGVVVDVFEPDLIIPDRSDSGVPGSQAATQSDITAVGRQSSVRAD